MKRSLQILSGITGGFILAFIGASGYLGYSLTKIERVPLEGNPARLGLTWEDVSFYSADDNLVIKGWLLPAENSRRIVIMVHGESYHRDEPEIKMLEIAAALVKRDYNVLMFDLRGHGESEGDRITGGYLEKRDLLGAVGYVRQRGYSGIGVLGFSLGAATAVLAAAENNDIDAVAADSAFADLNDIIESEYKNRTSAPTIFLSPILFMIKLMYGIDFTAIKPVESVREIAPRPVFIIHGEQDERIPASHGERLYNAAVKDSSSLWVVPGSKHCKAYQDYPEEYIERLDEFLDAALR
ncbi:MAG: alpha/beta hydrolase [Dehalococcoidales bacterium]|nr:alpha/beta hydrolase [Dehalococcoidales bacterium]